MNTQSHKTWLTACVLLGVLGVPAALADQIRINGIWIPDVEILGVEEGQIHYITNTGADSYRKLGEVQGLKLERYPDYAKAVEQLTAGDDEKAVASLVSLRKQARGKTDWLANDIGSKLVAAYDRLGQGGDAVEAYLELVNAKADPVYLTQPPLTSVAAMPEADRQKLTDSIERASRRADASVRPMLEQLIAAVAGQGGTTTAADATPGGTGPATTPQPGGTAGIGQGNSNVYPEDRTALFPEGITRNGLGDLIVARDYRGAIKLADDTLRSTPKPALIFQKGLAELALAESGGDENLYKDAGLDFMRVVIYFPSSPYAGPAMLQAAYIHEKIGDAEQAESLYEQAGRALDPEDNPRYFKLYESLTGRS